MAEADNTNDYSEDAPPRRLYHQNNQSMRPSFSARGRGRGIPDPHVINTNYYLEDAPPKSPYQNNHSMRPPYSARGRSRGIHDPHVMNTNDYLEDAPPKRPHQNNQSMRPPYSARGRGRGRPNPHVMKAMHLFGVKDLREILDRKHQEEGIRGGPTDSSWSDSELEDSYHQQQKDRQVSQGGSPSRGSRGRGNFRGHNKPTFIQNPLNVTVQFSTSTGERNFSVDENNKLDDIRHVPDHMYSLQPFGEKVRGRGGNWRGRPREARVTDGEERVRGNERRGRGRGRGMSTRNREEVRAKSAERSDRMHENNVEEHKARGRGKNVRSRSVETRDRVEVRDFERDPRGRGGSFRGRGHRRGRGKRHTNLSDENTQVQDTTGEQCVDAEENNPEESEVKIEQATGGETGILVNQKKKQEGNEKLVITSSGQENRKRFVRFDLKDDDSEEQPGNIPENNVGDDTVECSEGVPEIHSETVADTAEEDLEEEKIGEENINESNCDKNEAIVDEKTNS